MILVDEPIWSCRGKHWCHLVSDTSFEELHSFAKMIGVNRSEFCEHGTLPRYDLSTSTRILAINFGALPVDSKYITAWAVREEPLSEDQHKRIEVLRAKYPKNW